MVQLTAWIAVPWTLRNEPDLINALLDDLLGLLAPYGVRSIWSAEPRTYRLTPRGRALLTEALADRRVEALIIQTRLTGISRSDPRVQGATTGTAHVNLGGSRYPSEAGFVSATIRPGRDLSPAVIAGQLAAFVSRWFGPLGAAAAFVSDDPVDSDGVTRHEYERHVGAPVTWAGVSRYLRGVFWGTGLGPGLCERLGGTERVLREAPVPLKSQLGQGVWLQLSAEPPAPAGARKRLASYLAPLLNWTSEERNALESPLLGPVVLAPAPPPLPAGAQPRTVPLELRGELGPDVAFSVYLAAPPTPDQQLLVEGAVQAWYQEGGEGAFGGEGFHSVSDPSVDTKRAVMRWSADLGHADAREALEALAKRLGALPGVTVERLVVGKEVVG